jgi:hypothetical protein
MVGPRRVRNLWPSLFCLRGRNQWAGVAVALIGVWAAKKYAQASLEQSLEAYWGDCQEIPVQE